MIRNLVKEPDVCPMVFMYLTKEGRVNVVGHNHIVEQMRKVQDLQNMFLPQKPTEPAIGSEKEGKNPRWLKVVDWAGSSILFLFSYGLFATRISSLRRTFSPLETPFNPFNSFKTTGTVSCKN